MIDLAERIEDLRTKKSLSKLDLSKKLDIDAANYNRLVKKGKKLSIEQLEEIAKAFDVTLRELLFPEDVQYPEKDVNVLNEKLIQKDEELGKLRKMTIQMEALMKLFLNTGNSYIEKSGKTPEELNLILKSIIDPEGILETSIKQNIEKLKKDFSE
ncbi:hypothetical protein DR864_12840 [Runella rosea]|uniref:HTH cro/C1-type domain-containing protein n=1 Tax=Runella rosea TaxID=2259595 RepID=A0A344TIV8_9BACT|nr:helix-turn-helix transcriptional regulator [Runella rosea]AXE18579.1 hypothetical protein DR864_12840 [Runella rosea]